MTETALLTVDLEFLEYTPAYRSSSVASGHSGVGYEGVQFLLDEFEKYDTSATFFVVGEIAEAYPEMVSRIAVEGHEIASHSHTHRRLSSLSSNDRRDELKDSKATIEAVDSSITVKGFRAPVFDFKQDHFTMLSAAGYEYDSSGLPARRVPGFYEHSIPVTKPSRAASFVSDGPSDVLEVPVSVMPYLRLPISGAWQRLLGRMYTTIGIQWLLRRGSIPVLYVHPWELVDIRSIAGLPKRVSYRTGAWMRETIKRILCQDLSFVAIQDFLDECCGL
jgi:peptidoglycan/xylan/chitin deacetylase (PgdA/CDA1 family)